MRGPIVLAILLVAVLAARAEAQRARTSESGGDVAPVRRPDVARLAVRISGLDAEQQARVRVGGDSAQRIAMADFEWRGRVSSVEFDEEDSRLFWDIKIVPDGVYETIVRYRIDALTGGVLGIREFTGIRGLSRARP